MLWPDRVVARLQELNASRKKTPSAMDLVIVATGVIPSIVLIVISRRFNRTNESKRRIEYRGQLGVNRRLLATMTDPCNAREAIVRSPAFYGIAIAMLIGSLYLVVACILLYSVTVYPNLPRYLGGGKSEIVDVLVKTSERFRRIYGTTLSIKVMAIQR